MRHLVEVIPSDAVAVTKSDTADNIYIGFYVGGDGDVAVVTAGGTTVTFTAVAAGSYIPLQVVKILVATTATNIVGFRP